jgi:hypothetical protein
MTLRTGVLTIGASPEAIASARYLPIGFVKVPKRFYNPFNITIGIASETIAFGKLLPIGFVKAPKQFFNPPFLVIGKGSGGTTTVASPTQYWG